MHDSRPSATISKAEGHGHEQIGEGFAVAYHEVVPQESKYRYRLTNALFKEHLVFLQSLSRGDMPNGQRYEISFDDGHRSNYENAYPLLEESGLKATFFVLAGRVGTSGDYISWQQAREMAAAGHRIQSHGWSHRVLTQCDSAQLREELVRSKRELEDRLGGEMNSISVPGGRWNERVLEACASAGYKRLFHSNPWKSGGMSYEVVIHGRLMITRHMDAAALASYARVSRSRRLYFRAKYGLKERIRDVLGDYLYHRVWCWQAKWNSADGMEVYIKNDSNSRRESGRR
jgi:peptidoglycan/xylan/chitin deacetylase (PgdA/CDA1 family)